MEIKLRANAPEPTLQQTQWNLNTRTNTPRNLMELQLRTDTPESILQ